MKDSAVTEVTCISYWHAPLFAAGLAAGLDTAIVLRQLQTKTNKPKNQEIEKNKKNPIKFAFLIFENQ